MAAYLYNIPAMIRPFVTSEIAVSKAFKETSFVRIHAKRNEREITQSEAVELLKAGFMIGSYQISFNRDPRSVK